MDLEQDYVFYALEVALTFLSISAAYMIDVTRPVTFLYLLPITVLFGYTAFVSRYDFRVYSTLSLTGLSFMVVGGVVAAVAVFVAIGNILVSVFASGSGFRNYYGATSLPLLFTGLILGASIFGLAVKDPSVANNIRQETSSYMGQQTETIANRSNLLQSQKSGQAQLVNQTATASFTLTRRVVLKEMAQNSSLSHEEYRKLEETFETADKAVKGRLVERTSNQIQSKSIDLSARVSDLVSNSLKGKAFIILVPFITFGIYSLQPIVGILTAIWASIFAGLSSGKKEDSDS